MDMLRDSYANSAKSGFTIDFFSLTAPGSKEAFLASPFFSSYEPIRLLSERGCNIKLLIRLCTITSPQVLREALNDNKVSVRYYTAQSFHAKFYIVDDTALVGSANLTDSGLKSNREVSVVLTRERDAAFENLPGLFDLFWDYADVLTFGILDQYEKAFRAVGRSTGELEFEKFLESFIPKCEPPTVRVHSDKVTKRRSFLQTFRRKYDEILVPAFREVERAFETDGRRRPEFSDGDINIEISRFLGWARVVHAPGESWSVAPVLNGSLRASHMQNLIDEWNQTDNVTNGDMIVAEREIENIDRIRKNFATIENIHQLTYDDLFDTLTGCHAFMELLRFTDGGLPGLRKDFAKRNSLQNIHTTLSYLIHGSGDSLERAYDCIFDEHYRLGRFGEACVMELSGWVEADRVPINGRTIKALRFLGFKVSI